MECPIFWSMCVGLMQSMVPFASKQPLGPSSWRLEPLVESITVSPSDERGSTRGSLKSSALMASESGFAKFQQLFGQMIAVWKFGAQENMPGKGEIAVKMHRGPRGFARKSNKFLLQGP